MSAQQTSYNLAQSAPSQPGLVADSDVQGARVTSFRNDNASPFPFGLLVSKSSNTDDRGFDTLSTSAAVLGVLSFAQVKVNGTDGLPATQMGDILEDGEVYVTVVHAVTPNDVVRVFTVDYSGTTTGAVVGAFGTTAVATKTAVLASAKYTSRASAGGVAKVRLNLPGAILLTTES